MSGDDHRVASIGLGGAQESRVPVTDVGTVRGAGWGAAPTPWLSLWPPGGAGMLAAAIPTPEFLAFQSHRDPHWDTADRAMAWGWPWQGPGREGPQPPSEAVRESPSRPPFRDPWGPLALEPSLQSPPLSLRGVFSLCVSPCLFLSSYTDTCHIGLVPPPLQCDLILTNYTSKDPISQ